MLAACGRQVTFPKTPGGGTIPSGDMLIRYRVQGAFDFSNYSYAIIFNTSGQGTTPYANTFLAGFANYSYGWFIGGQFGTVQSPPVLVQYYLTPGSSTNVGTQQIVVPLQFAQLSLNSNGANTEFTLLFSRALLDRPPIGQATPSPTPSPAPTATGPSPSPGASITPTPSPSPSTGSACSNGQYLFICSQWFVNFFVLDRNGVPLDALGINGRNDTTFSLPLPTNQFFDYVQQLTKPAGAVTNGNPSASLAGGEIVNNP
jgi:hypothetical protein